MIRVIVFLFKAWLTLQVFLFVAAFSFGFIRGLVRAVVHHGVVGY
jgi:hypothetical protein